MSRMIVPHTTPTPDATHAVRKAVEAVRDPARLADIHHIRQGDPLGLGHAVPCARHHVGDAGVVRVTGLVEKRSPEDAPSRHAVIGRYVLDPAVFGILKRTPPGAAARSS